MSEVLDIPMSERFFAEYSPKKLGGIAMRFTAEPLDMTFLLINHGEDAHIPEVASELIAANDVILVEGAGWQPVQQNVLDKVSSGDATAFAALEIIKSPFHTALYKQLSGKNKPILYCDRPYSRRFADEVAQVNKFPAGLNTTTSVDVAASILARKYRETYQSVLGRDKYILANMAFTAASVKTDSDQKTLFIVGAGHMTLPYVMRRDIERTNQQDKHSVNEVFPYDTISYQMRLYGEFLSGKPFTEELLLKDMILRRMFNKNDEQIALLNELSPEETREIYAEKLLPH